MNFLPEEIESYAHAHTEAEPELLRQLSDETWQKVLMPRMLSGHLQGRLLSTISHLVKPKCVLEIGTYTGYSALCLAEGLVEGGKLITIDINDELQWIQDKYFARSPHGRNIERHFGNALDIIPKLTMDFDLVFIDADKDNYVNYYNMLMPRMKPGSVILVDNVLWSGKVLYEPDASDIETIALRELNELVLQDDRVQNVLLPVRDGLMMIRVK